MITNNLQNNYILKKTAASSSETVAITHKIILYNNPDYNNLTVTTNKKRRRPVLRRRKLQALLILRTPYASFAEQVSCNMCWQTLNNDKPSVRNNAHYYTSKCGCTINVKAGALAVKRISVHRAAVERKFHVDGSWSFLEWNKRNISLLECNTGLFIRPSRTSELDGATTKTDTAERSISIGRESLKVFLY